MNPQTTLKPCPFCGSDEVSFGYGEYGDGVKSIFVECEKCGATSHGNHETVAYNVKEKAAQQWNARAYE